jgi:hypothetical protein
MPRADVEALVDRARPTGWDAGFSDAGEAAWSSDAWNRETCRQAEVSYACDGRRLFPAAVFPKTKKFTNVGDDNVCGCYAATGHERRLQSYPTCDDCNMDTHECSYAGEFSGFDSATMLCGECDMGGACFCSCGGSASYEFESGFSIIDDATGLPWVSPPGAYGGPMAQTCQNTCQQVSPEKGFGSCADCCMKKENGMNVEALPLCPRGSIVDMHSMVHLACPDEEDMNGNRFQHRDQGGATQSYGLNVDSMPVSYPDFILESVWGSFEDENSWWSWSEKIPSTRACWPESIENYHEIPVCQERPSLANCRSACTRYERCLAFNYRTLDNGTQVCDLLSSSGLKLTKGLEDGETGSHAETKYLGKWICLPGENREGLETL